jgi:hypothetical protein
MATVVGYALLPILVVGGLAFVVDSAALVCGAHPVFGLAPSVGRRCRHRDRSIAKPCRAVIR